MICNIFAGADISDYSWVKPKNGYNIAADRGLIHCQRLGIAPDLILGDFDSYGGKLPENADILRAPAEKDDTDTMLAVKCGFEQGCDDFRIYGGLGGRFGHTAANVQTLMYIMSHGGKGYLYGGEYDITVQQNSCEEYADRGYRYVSLFALSERCEAELSGLKYSGRVSFANDFPLGASNEFSEKTCRIEVFSGKLLIVFEKNVT